MAAKRRVRNKCTCAPKGSVVRQVCLIHSDWRCRCDDPSGQIACPLHTKANTHLARLEALARAVEPLVAAVPSWDANLDDTVTLTVKVRDTAALCLAWDALHPERRNHGGPIDVEAPTLDDHFEDLVKAKQAVTLAEQKRQRCIEYWQRRGVPAGTGSDEFKHNVLVAEADQVWRQAFTALVRRIMQEA